MEITETPEEIVLRYVPVRELLGAGAMVLLSGFLLLWVLYIEFRRGNVLSRLQTGWDEFALSYIFGAMLLLALYCFLKIPLVTVTLRHKTKTVDAQFRRIYGSRTQRYYFQQISFFKSYEDSIDDAPYYHLAVVLANFKEVQLKAVIGKEKWEAAKFIKKLNKFIRAYPPPPKTQKPSKPSKKSRAN